MIYLTFAWGMQVTHDAAGKPLFGEEELKLLKAAVIAKCDLDDGLKDGIIGNAQSCSFDPMELACKSGLTSGCLSSTQVEAARKVYAGPTTSRGERLWLGGPLPGSEYDPGGADWRESYRVHGKPTKHTTIALEGFRYLFFLPEPGPTLQIGDLDFDRDYKRLALMQSLYDSSNPDLRRFKEAGGKLIIYQNMNDISVLPRATIDYYETVERTMGGRSATQDALPRRGRGVGS
jgi:feruloyl esterase